MAIKGPLGFKLKFAYGIGQAGEGLKNAAFGTFLLFYYNQVLGLPGTLAGIAVGTAVIVDAFTDPLAGSLSDHWKSPLGRRHPFMYASIIPLCVSFYFLFNPMVESQWALFAWLIVFTNLTRTSMSLYHVPHIAMGAELTDDFRERSSVVGFRTFMGTFGALIAVFAGFRLFFAKSPEFANGQLNEAAYAPYALFISVLMAITIFWSAWGTRSAIPYLPKVKEDMRLSITAIIVRVLVDVKAAMRCGSFRWLFSGVLVIYIVVGVDGALNIYIYTYFWELTPGDISLLVLAYPIGVMLGAFVAPMLHDRFSKKAGLIFGGASWPFWQILPIVLRLLDYFPDNSSALLLPLLILIRLIQGASTVQANVAYSSMVADVVDEHELASGQRQEGIFFAAVSFSAKAASGFGTIVAGFGLDIINWPRGAEIRTAADVPADTLLHLGILYGPVVAGFGVVSVLCYLPYSLTRERHAEILETLQTRRDAEPATIP
jgi:GPH family glycoside/pentoside/hexuronide:cation symporter